jgi:hypothetical protein
LRQSRKGRLQEPMSGGEQPVASPKKAGELQRPIFAGGGVQHIGVQHIGVQHIGVQHIGVQHIGVQHTAND